jgi:hypothetical protein
VIPGPKTTIHKQIRKAGLKPQGGFSNVAFPVVKRVFAGLIANEIVSVQPMTQPSGLLFYLDYTYGGKQKRQGSENQEMRKRKKLGEFKEKPSPAPAPAPTLPPQLVDRSQRWRNLLGNSSLSAKDRAIVSRMLDNQVKTEK